ncbi:MAG: GNAT family N-acetyltransferase [Roseibium sp.]|nr:GNAT family N-acetyltransferase [Roseibium sp.]
MPIDVSIRCVMPDDLQAVTDLSLRAKRSNGYDEAFMALCVDELTARVAWLEDGFWLAEADGVGICGCVRLSVETGRDCGEVETCFVDPACQGRGVGRALFQHLLTEAKALGLSALQLDADPYAVAFYQRMGFVTIGTSPSASIPGRSLPRMERPVPHHESGM